MIGLSAGALRALALAIAVTLPAVRGQAATTEWIVVDQLSGLAIAGYDPVAYFTEGSATTGRDDLEYEYAGASWRFRNEGNRAAFIADPQVFMPQFGGYDPVDIARGAPLAGDPRLWMLRGERLYLFYTDEARARFASDSERILIAAERRWPSLKKTLTP